MGLIGRAARLGIRGGVKGTKGAVRLGGGLLGGVGRLGGGLGTLGFGLASWAQLFAEYYPRITHTVTVKAQGGPLASGNAVVHTALAAAFGCIPQTRIGSINLSVYLDHTKNEAEVEFKISSLALIDALAAASKVQLDLLDVERLLDEDLAKAATEIGAAASGGFLSPEAIKKAGEAIGKWANRQFKELGLKDDPNKFVQGGVPGVVRPGGPNDAGQPPAVARNNLEVQGNDADVSRLTRRVFDIYKKVSTTLGQGIIWRIGRHAIKGGKAPEVLSKHPGPGDPPRAGLVGAIGQAADIATGADTYDRLLGRTLLTREPAGNPQMPVGGADPYGGFGFGLDLRTLVAQVLHDPGVRPPTPRTSCGPIPVGTEEFGV